MTSRYLADRPSSILFFFFFNDTATTEIYTLSLHDALPILIQTTGDRDVQRCGWVAALEHRSEEHTSELQSQSNLVCRLLLEKKKNNPNAMHHSLHEPTSGQSTHTLANPDSHPVNLDLDVTH